MLVDRAMFRHRLFGIEFKPTNTMNNQTGTQAPAQAGIEDFNHWGQSPQSHIARWGLAGVSLGSVSAVSQIRLFDFLSGLDSVVSGAPERGVSGGVVIEPLRRGFL
jgi:hypothetical protein